MAEVIIIIFCNIFMTILCGIVNIKGGLAMVKDVLPEHSCSTCKHYEKPVGADPCLECISEWTKKPASKWEEEK